MPLLEFDPRQVGKLEAGWWKAHHEHDRELMLNFLVKQHTILYSMTKEEALQTLRSLAEATKYHDERDWGTAIEFVTKYYNAIKSKTGLQFDPTETARLEVGWWKLHDELEFVKDKTPLAEAFAKLYATEFGLPIGTLKKAGRLKAQATFEHDLAEDPNTDPNEVGVHWKNAEQLLIDFYKELKTVLSNA